MTADWKSSRPRDWVKQRTLEQSMFGATSKKSSVVAGGKQGSSRASALFAIHLNSC